MSSLPRFQFEGKKKVKETWGKICIVPLLFIYLTKLYMPLFPHEQALTWNVIQPPWNPSSSPLYNIAAGNSLPRLSSPLCNFKPFSQHHHHAWTSPFPHNIHYENQPYNPSTTPFFFNHLTPLNTPCKPSSSPVHRLPPLFFFLFQPFFYGRFIIFQAPPFFTI